MADESLAYFTVQELTGRIHKKEVSPVEVTEAVLARIERLNPEINAFTTVTAESMIQGERRTDLGTKFLPGGPQRRAIARAAQEVGAQSLFCHGPAHPRFWWHLS